MQLSYLDLINPLPINLKNIGQIKSPKLIEIANLSYDIYNLYLSILLMTPEDYYKHYQNNKLEQYQNLSLSAKTNISIYQLIIYNSDLLELLRQTLSFFFVEIIVYNDKDCTFYTYQNQDDVINKKPIGFINQNNYQAICDVILQRNAIVKKTTDEDIGKMKNKTALQMYLKMKKHEEQQNKNKSNKKIEIPNLISVMSAYHSSLNIINIWDLTVYQLYDQFQRQQLKIIYDMQSTQVSVWGDEKNKFDYSQWYKTIK